MTLSWLGAPTQRTVTVVGGGGGGACLRVCVHACVHACVMCIAIYDNDILPKLIMIIIKIIILYFIQIRHIDDSPERVPV